jgi:hypothetical protein
MYGLKGLVQMVTLVTSLLRLRFFCHQLVTMSPTLGRPASYELNADSSEAAPWKHQT